MQFAVQLISLLLFAVALVLSTIKNRAKNINILDALEFLRSLGDAFQDFKTQFKNLAATWKEMDFSEIGAQVREDFVFLKDRQLERILENMAIALLNLIGGLFNFLAAIKEVVLYLKPISEEEEAKKKLAE